MDKKSHHGVSRRNFVGSLAGLAAGSPLLAAAAEQKPRPDFTDPLSKEKLPPAVQASKPNGLNLIVIICDTFRYDYLHCTGNGRIRTPHLDALAEEGTLFTNCYADGLPTIPARRVMHTGRSILPDRVKWRPLNKSDVTLAEILAKAGFTCGFIADTPHYFKPDMNFHRGFTSWQWIRGGFGRLRQRPAQVGQSRGPRAAAPAQSPVPRTGHPVSPEHEGPAGRGGLFLRPVLYRRQPLAAGQKTTATR